MLNNTFYGGFVFIKRYFCHIVTIFFNWQPVPEEAWLNDMQLPV